MIALAYAPRRRGLRVIVAVALLLGLCFFTAGRSSRLLAAGKQSRYVFVLPPGYIGWVQVIFGDPAASPLPLKDKGYYIRVPEEGIVRTSDILVRNEGKNDEFYYQDPSNSRLEDIPRNYVLAGAGHGGFDVMGTGGKGNGYSWFVFIGPASIRDRTPLADNDKTLESWHRINGNYRIEATEPYPQPGRIQP